MRHALLLGACATLVACGPAPITPYDAGSPPPPPPPRLDAGTPPPPPPGWVTLETSERLESPPALAGGTLEVTSAGLIIAGDPERAAIWVLDPAREFARGRIDLDPGDEPGRVAADSLGNVHVILRGAGAVLTIDPETATELERRAVCGAPRGIAWDQGFGHLWVTCAGGEVLALPPSRGPAELRWTLDDDLRDVIVSADRLYISRFRSAELLDVARTTGEIYRRRAPRSITEEVFMRPDGPSEVTRTPNTAWRIRLDGFGNVVMVHQTSAASALEVEMMGYSGGSRCGGGVVAPAISVFPTDGGPAQGGNAIADSVLVVDVATAPHADQVTVAVGATDAIGVGFGQGTVRFASSQVSDMDCVFGDFGSAVAPGPVHAVAYMPDGALVSLYHEPFAVRIEDGATFVGPNQARPRGYELFHTMTPSMTACASCHPEGGEDGHTWEFVGTGLRRTQTLLGGLLETAPFHWSGDQADMDAIMVGGFMQRMGGRASPEDATVIADYLDGLPLPARPTQDADAVARGEAHFEAACASCHAGDAYTNNENVDVGTGDDFQVPSLRGVAYRAPYFHDGCAQTLDAVVVGECASGHAQGDALNADERADLLAFVRTL